MLGGADNPNGELPSYITGADTLATLLSAMWVARQLSGDFAHQHGSLLEYFFFHLKALYLRFKLLNFALFRGNSISIPWSSCLYNRIHLRKWSGLSSSASATYLTSRWYLTACSIASSLNSGEKVRLVRRVLIMHHLIFTVLTLTGFRGVLNYRSTTHQRTTIVWRSYCPGCKLIFPPRLSIGAYLLSLKTKQDNVNTAFG